MSCYQDSLAYIDKVIAQTSNSVPDITSYQLILLLPHVSNFKQCSNMAQK